MLTHRLWRDFVPIDFIFRNDSVKLRGRNNNGSYEISTRQRQEANEIVLIRCNGRLSTAYSL